MTRRQPRSRSTSRSIPLTTLSETKFYFPGGFPIDFVKDSHGAVSHFLLHAAEGDMKFIRTGKP
jgi:hypothetical protein